MTKLLIVSNAERDGYIETVTGWITDEQFTNAGEPKIDGDVYTWEILSGEKRQTIRRASQKWENVKAGDKLTLYTGLRTKQCRKLGEAVVESVGKVAFYQAGLIGAITRDGEFWLTADEVEELVRRDGFGDVYDFWKFFDAHYPERPIEMNVIRWTDFKEAKDER